MPLKELKIKINLSISSSIKLTAMTRSPHPEVPKKDFGLKLIFILHPTRRICTKLPISSIWKTARCAPCLLFRAIQPSVPLLLHNCISISLLLEEQLQYKVCHLCAVTKEKKKSSKKRKVHCYSAVSAKMASTGYNLTL